MHGFYRIAACAPEMRVADIGFNTEKIINLALKAAKDTASLALFPELAVCGYTCGDLFNQPLTVDESLKSALKIAAALKSTGMITVFGSPAYHKSSLYNCAFVAYKGKIMGIVPKSNLPNYREFYERRWFCSGHGITGESIELNGEHVPFGTDLLFQAGKHFIFGVEICEDLWSVVPPSSFQALEGALITLNPSASNELVSKSDYRRELIKNQSARCVSAYVYASSGVHESTTDLVYGGHAVISENGCVLAENERFNRASSMTFADIDCERLFASRISESSFANSLEIAEKKAFRTIKLGEAKELKSIKRQIDPHPFVPSAPELRNTRCKEIFSIQAAGLAKRLEHTGLSKAVIGISGGLDSTLALLVCAETFRLTGRKNSDIITITMPGFGTTSRTHGNASKLCKILKTDFREICIKEACLEHFKSIGHDRKIHDVTYENTQARERTQLLMDIANREKGLVIGTGDLSEIAMGWSTYNGDHMSMYAVNCSVPKTLIRYLINWVADHSEKGMKNVLNNIIDTPVSPELLPHENGKISQKTEELIGPYELHDFYLYHMIKYGACPEKILFLAEIAFRGKYSRNEIHKYLRLFLKRFFSQQFKRSCIPDGPKVGTISLSPRGDWRMPSDASPALWLEKI